MEILQLTSKEFKDSMKTSIEKIQKHLSIDTPITLHVLELVTRTDFTDTYSTMDDHEVVKEHRVLINSRINQLSGHPQHALSSQNDIHSTGLCGIIKSETEQVMFGIAGLKMKTAEAVGGVLMLVSGYASNEWLVEMFRSTGNVGLYNELKGLFRK